MAFVANPLSLSIPPSSFEAWLRENGHLEHLDKCAVVDQHRPSHRGIIPSILSFAVNPFGSLTVEDLNRRPAAWTGEFWDCGGIRESYGLPISGTQLKLRMGENLKRYMGNYLRLSVLILACFIYKMPLTLCGIFLVLALWESLRMLINYFKLESESLFYQAFLLVGKIVSTVVLIYFKVALAVCWAGIFSFAVMIVHSSLRKITSPIGDVKLRKRQ